MKRLYSLLLALVLLPGLLFPHRASAQEAGPAPAQPNFTNCFPNKIQRPAGAGQQAARSAQSQSSNYGWAVTPQGVLKVLVVFAGFTNDVNTSAPDYYDLNGTNPWPQKDGVHAPGLSFPKNVSADFYTSLASFQNNAVDHTLSNFYYQMSQHSANPFKMQAIFFPKRINVTATDAKNARPGGFFDYTDEVMTALKNDPDTQNFDFSKVDQRGASPYFDHDNSNTPPDNSIDYTVIIWRNSGTPYQTVVPPGGIAYTGAGWAGVPGVSNIPSANGQFYSTSVGFTQAFGMSGLSQETFLHEFAHTLYNSPHYLAANRTVGTYFNLTDGPGMMGGLRTHFLANAWERWYNGWVELQTGANHANSDVQGAASLTATNGEFTLRDYVTTGDVMRIKLPNSSQYLWLENHQFISALDGRVGYLNNTQNPPQPLRGAPHGIIAMVEDVASSRSNLLNAYDIGCNGMKVVSAQGNFDYTISATTSTYNNYFFNYQLYDFSNPIANPFGGESQITRRRVDLNSDNIIYNDRSTGNEGTVSELTTSFRLNGAFEDGLFGPDAAFNTVGQKMGNASNPAIFEQQQYDQTNARLAPINLGGLSVELIAKDANTGAITVKVRYDDVDVAQDTRWSGNFRLPNNADAAAAGYGQGTDVHVTNGATLTINKSGTSNRHSLFDGKFINPTTFTCTNGALFALDAHSTVSVEGSKTAFIVENGTEVRSNTATFVVKDGAVLDIKSGGTYNIQGGYYNMQFASVLRVEAGGTLIVRSGGNLIGNGVVQIQDGAYVCFEQGANLSVDPVFTLDVARNAVIGANPALNLGPLNCNSQLQFCGRMPGGNAELSAVCPTGNEALLFDGVDDVVRVPNTYPSLIHNMGQTFTIEASLRSDVSGGPNQTIFSNRQYDPSYGTRGMLFTLYGGEYLLLQLQGQNFYDFSDPLMRIAPNSGCHQVAVTRDNTNTVHFYIDGRQATYSPVVSYSPYSSADVRFGGDLPYANQVFNGQIGEIRAWNVARSAADIRTFMSSSLAAQPGLIAYYDMRDVTGQSVSDQAIIYTSGYYSPTAWLGTTTNADGSDPTWVSAASLTCTVGGNFRAAPLPAQPDTTGQARTRIAVGSPAASTQYLSSLTLSPNPASGEAVLHFQLRKAGPVTVSVQDLAGLARATVPLATTVAEGAHDVRLPLHGLKPGVYAVVIVSADGRQVIRLEVR